MLDGLGVSDGLKGFPVLFSSLVFLVRVSILTLAI
jgi:hypothetical protein